MSDCAIWNIPEIALRVIVSRATLHRRWASKRPGVSSAENRCIVSGVKDEAVLMSSILTHLRRFCGTLDSGLWPTHSFHIVLQIVGAH